MKPSSRIPALNDTSADGMLIWFGELSKHGLLFHIDDDPATIISARTNMRFFDDAEAEALRASINRLFELHDDAVYDAAYPVFMKACGQRLDS